LAAYLVSRRGEYFPEEKKLNATTNANCSLEEEERSTNSGVNALPSLTELSRAHHALQPNIDRTHFERGGDAGGERWGGMNCAVE